MRNLAKVLEVSQDQQTLTVLSLTSSACINCPSIKACRKNSTKVTVSNKSRVPVQPGDYIKIELSLCAKTITGLFSLFTPLLLAAAGYFFCPSVSFKAPAFITENFPFIVSSLFLFTGELAVFLFSKSSLMPSKPVLLQVL